MQPVQTVLFRQMLDLGEYALFPLVQRGTLQLWSGMIDNDMYFHCVLTDAGH